MFDLDDFDPLHNPLDYFLYEEFIEPKQSNNSTNTGCMPLLLFLLILFL